MSKNKFNLGEMSLASSILLVGEAGYERYGRIDEGNDTGLVRTSYAYV